MVVPSSSESVSSATTTDEQSVTTLESTALYQRSVLKKKQQQQQQQQQQHQQHPQHAAVLRTASSSSSSSSSSTSTCTTEATSATSITYASLLDEPEREDDAISTANSISDGVDDNNNNRSSKRRVRFAQLNSSHIRLIPLCFEFDNDDIEALWYGPHEVMQFKQAQRQLAKETRLQGSRLTKPIDTAYRQAQVLAVSVSERGLPQLNTSVLSQPLVPWVRRVQTCRGLEHWASKAHHTCRMDGKNNAKKAVTGSQAMLSLKQSEQQDASPLSPMSTQKHTQDMARLYGNASRASFLVARWLGEADAFYKVKQEQEKHLRNQVMREYYLQKIRSMKNHKGQTVESDKEEMKSLEETPQEDAVSQHDVPQQQQELLSRLQQLVQDIDVEEDSKSCASDNDNDDELDDDDFDDDTTDDNSTIRSTSSSFAARVAAAASSNASNANHHSNHQQHSSWFAVPLTTSSWHRSNTVSSNGSVSSASSSGSRQRRRSASHNHNGITTTPPHIHQSPPNSIKRAYVRSAGEA